MYKVKDFISWAVDHSANGSEPWHYLYGSTRVLTTRATLNQYFNNHYSNKMTRQQFDEITADWLPTDYATDCQGLLDAYLTYACNDKTDVTAAYNYTYWCSDKGKIADIDRPYVIGEAVFEESINAKTGQPYKNHVGWVCGFDTDGTPLVVEARGITYGVVITSLTDRNWSYRGLMTAEFEYEDESPKAPLTLDLTTPRHSGDAYKAMQDALNLLGYTDDNGDPLKPDGVWGPKSRQAWDKAATLNNPATKHTVAVLIDGEIKMQEVLV